MSVPANFFDSYTVVASPSDDTETVIATLDAVSELLPDLTVHLRGWVSILVDEDATGVTLQVRRGSIDGDGVGAEATITFLASGAALEWLVDIEVSDQPGDFAGAVYVLTATVTDAAAASDISAVHFGARVC